MAKKNQLRNPKSPKPRNAVSKIADLVMKCHKDRAMQPVLADFLGETLGLKSIAAMLRSPDLWPVSERFCGTEGFEFYLLADDAFFWLVDVYRAASPERHERWFVFGLYAYPKGQPRSWAKFTNMLINEPKSASGPNEHIAKARSELAKFSISNEH